MEVIGQKLELSVGITTVLARMRTNPEEFFGNSDKWKFLFSENLQQVLTEVEKGALFEGFKAIRRQELDALVMATLLKDKNEEQEQKEAMRFDSSGRLGIGTAAPAYQQQSSQSKNAQALKGAKRWLP